MIKYAKEILNLSENNQNLKQVMSYDSTFCEFAYNMYNFMNL